MFRSETPEADRALERVSRSLIEHYPELVYGHMNLGLLAMIDQRYDEAHAHLERARALDPEDEIVLGNIRKLAELEAASTRPARVD